MKPHSNRTQLVALVTGCLLLLAIVNVHADYEQPVERPDDPKIVSRDVKCLGKYV